MIRENSTKIGYFSKPHGIDGSLVLRLSGNFADEIEPGEPLFVEKDSTLVPFFIEEITPIGDRAIVKFEFIGSESIASRYVSCNVWSLEKEWDYSEDHAQLFVSYSLTDQNSGRTGLITALVENPENPVYIVKFGNNEVLIPVSADFIVKTDHRRKLLVMNLPEGLLEI